ncbi:hypothetical protein NC651_020288 [Populus alba x Populus x berolinensis]|nr:hypothetical protein NC651_020288 [Populus alba x Populus x berolinensis]
MDGETIRDESERSISIKTAVALLSLVLLLLMMMVDFVNSLVGYMC